ncbi:glutaredoxin family protein [Microbacterium allomyrinae]|uniref:Glutaredoxin family protein n=1 Tax=Microbacterium allomyrinae TaxID=2830666 RepID=A0A9X1S1C9_9MICO|nr:glutaredoxin family protein [Microbacterium allomyrinae]MCC2031556.1 glutaredoxin family protein [Microbacterium allomyrinae]
MTTDANAIIMYGTGWCGDCTRSKAALRRLGEDFVYIDIEADDAASVRAQEISGAKRIPVIVFPDGEHLVEPSELALRTKVLELRA